MNTPIHVNVQMMESVPLMYCVVSLDLYTPFCPVKETECSNTPTTQQSLNLLIIQ